MIKFKLYKLSVLLLTVFMFVAVSSLSATPPGQVNDEVSANAMYVTYASVDENVLLIQGFGFPEDKSLLTVFLAGEEQDIFDVDVNGDIIVGLSANVYQGDNLLVVTNNKKPVRTASFMLTIGAVGPQGVQGERGVQGAQGKKGDKGDTGLQGEMGSRGFTGLQGPQGEQGIQGEQSEGTSDGHSLDADDGIPVDALYVNKYGNVGIGTMSPQAKLDVAGAIRIRGADIAEQFPVTDNVRPGMVLAIDPDNPGKLRLARGAYNARVAGIVSGANGLPAGAILGNMPGMENDPAIALSGRVWCLVDADSGGSVNPGDMLTTSDIPGHAMKVTDHAKAQGAILGKAMTKLESGRDLVLVLVTLQ